MALANVNNQKRQILSGLLTNRPTAAIFYGDVYYATDSTLWYIYTPSGWIEESLPAIVAAIGASENHIGQTGYWSNLIPVTPVLTNFATPYSANDNVGAKFAIPGAVRVSAGLGIMQSVIIVDKSEQAVPLTILLFKSEPAGSYVDNAPEAVSAADWLLFLGQMDIVAADYATRANASVVSLGGYNLDIKAAAGTTIYGLIVTTDTPTYTAIDALQLTFGVR